MPLTGAAARNHDEVVVVDVIPVERPFDNIDRRDGTPFGDDPDECPKRTEVERKADLCDDLTAGVEKLHKLVRLVAAVVNEGKTYSVPRRTKANREVVIIATVL